MSIKLLNNHSGTWLSAVQAVQLQSSLRREYPRHPVGKLHIPKQQIFPGNTNPQIYIFENLQHFPESRKTLFFFHSGVTESVPRQKIMHMADNFDQFWPPIFVNIHHFCLPLLTNPTWTFCPTLRFFHRCTYVLHTTYASIIDYYQSVYKNLLIFSESSEAY